MTLQEKMDRLFTNKMYLSQHLRRQHTMPEQRIEDAINGKDAEAEKIVDDFLTSELERTDYGIYIKTIRAAAGVGQGELAASIGKTRASLTNYESGRRQPNLDVLLEVIRVVAKPDRLRQLGDLSLQKKFELYLDVLHAIYDGR